MSQRLQAEGRFKARIVNHGVGTTKEKGLPQWVARFAAFEQEGFLTDANGNQVYDESTGRPKQGWVPLDDEYEIIDFLPLAYVDKNTNQREFTNTFNSLQEALGWTPDANDIFGSLQNLDLSAVNVQIVVNAEEYQGQTRYKVAFVNPVDYEGGGVRQLDGDALKKLQAEWGSTFRAKFGAAHAGGAAPAPAQPAQPAPAAPQPQAAPTPTQAAPAAPAAAPAPAAAAPATPSTPAPPAAGAALAAAPAPAGGAAPAAAPAPASPAPAQPQPQQRATPSPAKPATQAPAAAVNPERPAAPMPGEAYSGGEATMEEAWAAFNSKKGNMTDEGLGEEWFREIADNFGARTEDEISALTPAQWAWLRDHGDPIPF